MKGRETFIWRAGPPTKQTAADSIFSIIKLSRFEDHLGIMGYQRRWMVPTGVIDHVPLRGTAHPRFDLLRNATLDVISICKQFKEKKKIKGRRGGETDICSSKAHTQSPPWIAVCLRTPPGWCFSEQSP